ncbi:MAG TPA: DUF2586 family protein [Ferruginibacter sp.]|nr:DUF2586 family protein [Ferruginibacter sp.]HMP22174.1 DUF2586 family protein [Ferruginibacter sp.]
MGSIIFNKQNNRSKRVVPGEDHYVALVFYSDTLPEGFSNDERIKLVADVEAAKALGIDKNNPDVLIKVMAYHIAELYRINPNAILWVGIFDEPTGEHTFDEVQLVRAASNNKVRKVGVFTREPYAEGHISLLQQQYNAAAEIISMFEIFYAPDFKDVDTDNLPDLSAATSPNVHLLAAQDGGAYGAQLFAAANFSIGIIGAALGAISLARVNENIGWVEKFNMAVDGGELDVPALANGVLVKNLANNITKGNGILDGKRLIFLKQYPNITGSYFNDSHGACPATSDYAYAEDNITIDKAIRGIYARMMPKVNGPSLLQKGTGKLAAESLSILENAAGDYLKEMEAAGEISGYTVFIDPEQDVKATNQIVVEISNTSIGVNRNFIINIGF